MKRLVLIALPALLTACVEGRPGPVISCNAMYAPDQVHVDFSGYPLEDGDYVLVFESDEVVECPLTIPADPDAWIACDGRPEVMINVNNAGDLQDIVLWEYAPDSFQIELLQDDALLDSERYTPDYTIDEPNGEGCGERRFAEVVF